jgi:hypothetical protein
MSEQRRFSATIEGASGGGVYVTVPFDVEREYGKKRVPILAHIDGEPYRGTLVRMGSEHHLLLIRKDIRAKIGKDVGAEVGVTLEEDTAPRVVEVPPDLESALAAEPDAAAFFGELAFTHQREYVQWLAEAKRDQTRVARIEKIVEALKAGRRER